ncbi:ABC transporter permease [Dawidia soli]|nr:ABC transporter permease [Dawidia soli]
MNATPRPPHLFLRFFRWYCDPQLLRHIEGDLMEVYHERVVQQGARRASRQFMIDVLLLFRPGIVRPLTLQRTLTPGYMWKINMTLAWRNLVKGRGYSFINISGLAVGIAVAMLIGLWVADELSFDHHFANHERLMQVMMRQTNKGKTYTGMVIAPNVSGPLRTDYRDKVEAVALYGWNVDHIVADGDKKLVSQGIWAEASLPEMLTLEMLHGSRQALRDPSTMLISRSLAQALYGDANPVGKFLRLDDNQELTIGGVYQDLPGNTSFGATRLMLPWENKHNWITGVTEWDNHVCSLVIQLADGVDAAQLNEQIKTIPTAHIPYWQEEIMLYPMERMHLYGEFSESGAQDGGAIEFVWLFGTIGVFVLLLACINFMNLSTARSEKRSKEVGIRKTIGSVRRQLISQFLTESVVTAFCALLVALMLTQLSLPLFNTLAGKRIALPWSDINFWCITLGFTLLTGVLAGSYPAFYLSSFRPVKVLKGTFNAGRLASLPRRVLVVVQFTVSITLIIGTVIVFQQIQFTKDRPAGYNRQGLISVPISTEALQKQLDVVRHELLQTGVVVNLAQSSQTAARFGNNTGIEWRGKDPDLVEFFFNVTISPEFGETLQWKVREGRDFSREIPSDSSAAIVNVRAAEIMNLQPSPVGEVVKHGDREYTIIGVVDNMVTQTPYEPLKPCIFFMRGWMGTITIRLNPDVPVQEALAKIAPVFNKYNPSAPFDYRFVDDLYADQLDAEQRVGTLAGIFAGLAIFISCLGLFGLSSFVAERRTKEIGIRKVLGASVANLWHLLSKEFIVLVVISWFLALPLSVYYMYDWLQQFPYRITLSWTTFTAAALGVMALTLTTVSYQAIRASLAKPVNSLRSE